MSKNTSVIGIYPDRKTVSDAINVLHKAGYRLTDISVLSSDNQGSKDFGHERHTGRRRERRRERRRARWWAPHWPGWPPLKPWLSRV